MEYKSRKASPELMILEVLKNRFVLSEKEKQHYRNLKKGHECELLFDKKLSSLQEDYLILNDLLLKVNNTTFQIDTIIIANTIYLFEVKNYAGDYLYESDRIYKRPSLEIVNPLIQLNRSESLLRQLLQSLGFNFVINASVVFINPEFTLYQAPLDKPFIFPTQINNFLRQMNSTPMKLSAQHKALAKKLVSLHQKDSPYTQVPAYHEESLRKGITCKACSSFTSTIEGHKLICQACEYQEAFADAVIRTVKEIQLLLPKTKITTNLIYDWCKVEVPKRRIEKILKKNMEHIKNNRWSYFE
jgi:Nuclease-related domain